MSSYEIRTVDDFLAIGNVLKDREDKTAEQLTITLEEDIDFGNLNIKGYIGILDNCYNVIFDGKNHSLKNFKLTNYKFFGCTFYNSEFKNIVFDNIEVNSSSSKFEGLIHLYTDNNNRLASYGFENITIKNSVFFLDSLSCLLKGTNKFDFINVVGCTFYLNGHFYIIDCTERGTDIMNSTFKCKMVQKSGISGHVAAVHTSSESTVSHCVFCIDFENTTGNACMTAPIYTNNYICMVNCYSRSTFKNVTTNYIYPLADPSYARACLNSFYDSNVVEGVSFTKTISGTAATTEQLKDKEWLKAHDWKFKEEEI